MASPSLKYKLYYFNFRGRGELIRLLLHTAQVEFIDHRVQPSDWPELKPNLMGDTELDQLNADIILNYVDQLRLDYVRFKTDSLLTPEQKQILEEKFQKQDVPKFMNKIEKRLVKSTSKYLAGDKLSIADLAVADVLDTFIKENPSVLDSYPSLSEHKAMVMGLPQLSNYLSCRPDTKL
uniref:GST C-terminal domain-containing protein n=1 Tax=Biomphalaria glabrata TaxID=6526 RepID=A0A2C9KUV3_BIOGL